MVLLAFQMSSPHRSINYTLLSLHLSLDGLMQTSSIHGNIDRKQKIIFVTNVYGKVNWARGEGEGTHQYNVS